jgi:hypothetical protein
MAMDNPSFILDVPIRSSISNRFPHCKIPPCFPLNPRFFLVFPIVFHICSYDSFGTSWNLQEFRVIFQPRHSSNIAHKELEAA